MIQLLLGIALVAFHVVQRLVWLAPGRLGWLFYIANIVGEVGPKKLGVPRHRFETAAVMVGLLALWWGGLDVVFVLALSVVLLVWSLQLTRQERRFMNEVWNTRDTIGPEPTNAACSRGLARAYPAPSMHPQLTFTIIGPFTQRRPSYSMGTMAVGRRWRVQVVVGNHTITPTQTAQRLRVATGDGVKLLGEAERQLGVLKTGQIHRVDLDFEAVAAAASSHIDLTCEWGESTWRANLAVEAVLARAPRITSAAVTRWPGACTSAFAWRGDMDIYDTSTCQSIEGLTLTFDIASRYRMPQTMYLSSRLSLDEEEATRWAAYYGIDRGADQIPRFISWMNEHVELRHRASYPFDSSLPYLIELGNHGHLHYGTDTATAEENGWKLDARMGAGRYRWLSDNEGSLAEQRDNALEMRRMSELHFGFTPKSWAMPDRTNDAFTPKAMEAAGCEVLSDSDVRTKHNVLLQPPPHWAPGARQAVELTKRYPGDPEHIFHYWMNLFWIHRAMRKAIPVIFMCHQHMRQFTGWVGPRLTEAILRHVLHAFSGDFWINTVYGLGVYWRDVLSDRASVKIAFAAEGLRVESTAPLEHASIPVDVVFEDGQKATWLVTCPSRRAVQLDAVGNVQG
ncbi:MAG: hypothetical protein Q8O14_12345 [bacterium]|jgi:hypothetical protein|nr:hypothetical protein [bacterium]